MNKEEKEALGIYEPDSRGREKGLPKFRYNFEEDPDEGRLEVDSD